MPDSFTPGRRFLLTHRDHEGPLSVRAHYLLPDGRRRTLTLNRAFDDADTHAQIARAFELNRVETLGTKRRRYGR